jgi:hypothetical protein
MKIEDGGAAFPNDLGYGGGRRGMSLRDFFAAHALTGMLANTSLGQMPRDGTDTRYAIVAYEIADAMIAQRTKP